MVLQTTASKPRYALSAVSELLERGAHFVLAARWGDLKEDRTQSKKPVWTAWLDRRPDFTAVKDHLDRDGLLGIVPASLGMAVLDVDTGDATQLIVDYPPWFLARSQRHGRVHIWYRDSQKGRRGGDWRGHGCSGEIIASTGYVVLWNTALEELAEALRLGDFPGQGQVPFSAVAATVARWPSMPEGSSGKPAPGPAPAPAPAPELSTVLPGRRNRALFDHVRAWAYRRRPYFHDVDRYVAAVHACAYAGRNQFPDLEDFPTREAAAIADSVATFTWVWIAPAPEGAPGGTGEQGHRGDPALNSDSEVQRRRRGCRTALDAVRVQHRRQAVANRSVMGQKPKTLAAVFGVSERTIVRDLKEADLPSRRSARRTLQSERQRKGRRPEPHTPGEDRGTGQLTRSETTSGHSSPGLTENRGRQETRAGPPERPSTPNLPGPGRMLQAAPPDYGLVSQQGRDSPRDGPRDAGSGGRLDKERSNTPMDVRRRWRLPGLHDWLQGRPPGRADRLCRPVVHGEETSGLLNPRDGNCHWGPGCRSGCCEG